MFLPRWRIFVFGLMVLLDAYTAMIPKTDGNATPLGQRPLSVLPIVYRVWASARMSQLEGWFWFWVPDSVFSAGGGRGSVEAWFSSALDIEEVLAGATDSHLHLFVADVVKSFDTVDGEILDRVLSGLGLPGWFRHACFGDHAHVRLRFKLASRLGESWTRDGCIPQGCALSVMFLVALCLPWCRPPLPPGFPFGRQHPLPVLLPRLLSVTWVDACCDVPRLLPEGIADGRYDSALGGVRAGAAVPCWSWCGE